MYKNETAEYAKKILKEYADETSGIVRGTSDISPLEEWLLVRMYHDQAEPPQYKILSFKTTSLGDIFTLQENGKYKYQNSAATASEMFWHGHNIHSVLRISDKSIFTEGDIIDQGAIKQIRRKTDGVIYLCARKKPVR